MFKALKKSKVKRGHRKDLADRIRRANATRRKMLDATKERLEEIDDQDVLEDIHIMAQKRLHGRS